MPASHSHMRSFTHKVSSGLLTCCCFTVHCFMWLVIAFKALFMLKSFSRPALPGAHLMKDNPSI